MTQLLTLSRAARLVGLTRGALQKRIKDGELASFDGMITTEALLKVFPDTTLEDSGDFERVSEIKERAFARRVREHALPDKEVLAARLYEQGRDLAETRAVLERYHGLIGRVEGRLKELERAPDSEVRPLAASLTSWLWEQMGDVLGKEEPADALAVEDTIMRIMSAHVTVQPSRREFFVEGNDTLLEAALKAGLALNYGCSSGNCGLCKARVVSGQVQKCRHHDYVLTEAEKSQGYVLMCSNTAVNDLVVEALEASGARDIPEQHIQARVKVVTGLNDHVRLLHLQTPRSSRLRFLAGQRATVEIGNAAAEFPIASCPCDDRNVQFHVPNIPGNPVAARVFGDLKANDLVDLHGPWGEFALDDESPRSLIFIAVDAGFAPIKSLIEHAMALDFAETMHLYWIAGSGDGQYLANLCRAWQDALDNFFYVPMNAEEGGFRAALAKIVEAHPNLPEFDVYACGTDAFVMSSRELLGRAGLPPGQLVTAVA